MLGLVGAQAQAGMGGSGSAESGHQGL